MSYDHSDTFCRSAGISGPSGGRKQAVSSRGGLRSPSSRATARMDLGVWVVGGVGCVWGGGGGGASRKPVPNYSELQPVLCSLLPAPFYLNYPIFGGISLVFGYDPEYP